MSTAEQTAKLHDRRQWAVSDSAVSDLHGPGAKASPFRHPRHGEQIRPLAVERCGVNEVAVVELAAVSGCDRRECSRTTIVPSPLSDDRELAAIL